MFSECAHSVFTTTGGQHYSGLGGDFDHHHVVHTNRQYVNGLVHTNGIENFWALLKRALKGTQTHVNVEHLDRYVTERVFAYNRFDLTDLQRMQAMMRRVSGRRLTYAELTGGES